MLLKKLEFFSLFPFLQLFKKIQGSELILILFRFHKVPIFCHDK